MNNDLMEMILDANQRGYERAFEIAVRTGTALIFSRNGKTVEVKPPYRYELVPIKQTKKQSTKKKSKARGRT